MKPFILLLASLNLTQGFCQGNDKLVFGMQDICWSPDSKALFFSGMWHKPNYSDFKPEKWRVYKFDFKSKTTTVFVDSALTVSVANSGKEIAVAKIKNGNRDIYVVDRKGKITKRVTSHPSEDNWVTFSPDGKQIAFLSKRDGKHEIYVINTDSSGLKRLTYSNGGASFSPQWSPDGKKIVYYFEKGDSKDQIYVMNADGSNSINITSDTLHNYYPSWVSNEKLMYTNDRKNKTQKIVTCKIDGTEKQQLLEINTFYARISPRGDLVAYIDNKEQCIKVISMKGKILEKISVEGAKQ